jgi:Fe-S-cluster containining protein
MIQDKHTTSEYVRKVQYDTTRQTLGQPASASQIITLDDDAVKLTTGLMETAQQEPIPVACEAGCNFCCYLMATVSAPEVLAIVSRLEKTWAPSDLDQLRQQVQMAFKQTKMLNNHDRARAGIACPLLTAEGMCTIYDFRPLDCVTYHSMSREACEQLLVEPDRGHPTNAILQAIGVGVKTGLGQGMVDTQLEQPVLRYELIEALHIGLNDAAAMEKYLAGKNIFKTAAIIIDPDNGMAYKIEYAPPGLKAEAKRVIAAERRQARLSNKKRRKQRRF